MKATRVDGVFSDDPERSARRLYGELTYEDAPPEPASWTREAITKCQQYQMPILVFNFRKQGNIERAVCGERVGTLIRDKNSGANAPRSER